MTSLTEAQARAAIAPWYSLFNIASRGDVKAIQEQILTEDYESCAGYLPGECWGRETSIKVVSNFANSIPDMKFDIKEVLVAGDRVIVRGEVTGTPSGDCSACRIPARAFASWRSISRPSGTARSLRPSTWKTGSAPSGSFAPSEPAKGVCQVSRQAHHSLILCPSTRVPVDLSYLLAWWRLCRSPHSDLGGSLVRIEFDEVRKTP